MTIEITVGFPFSKFLTMQDAYDWITLQRGYKDKTVYYKVICERSVEAD